MARILFSTAIVLLVALLAASAWPAEGQELTKFGNDSQPLTEEERRYVGETIDFIEKIGGYDTIVKSLRRALNANPSRVRSGRMTLEDGAVVYGTGTEPETKELRISKALLAHPSGKMGSEFITLLNAVFHQGAFLSRHTSQVSPLRISDSGARRRYCSLQTVARTFGTLRRLLCFRWWTLMVTGFPILWTSRLVHA